MNAFANPPSSAQLSAINNRHVIEGPIEDSTTAILREFLERAGGAPVTIQMNSPGGIAFQGIAGFNEFQTYSGLVTVEIVMALSAASVIAMGADEIVMLKGGLIMIHEAAAMTFGPAAEHEKTAAFLQKLNATVAPIYADRTGLPIREVLAMMAEETWLNATEAVAAGFADRGAETGPVAYASYDYAQYRRTPAFLLNRGSQ